MSMLLALAITLAMLSGGVVLSGGAAGAAASDDTGDAVSGQEAIERIRAGAPLDSSVTGMNQDEAIELLASDPSLHLIGDDLVHVDVVDDEDLAALSALSLRLDQATTPLFPGTPRLRDLKVSAEDVNNALKLHSRPGSSKKIYLDFDGHSTTFDNYKPVYDFAAFDLDGDLSSFSTSEREWIVRWWSQAVADFDTWDVDVTTEEPPAEYLTKTDPSDETFGIRVMVTSTMINPAWRGVGPTNSFVAAGDIPAYVFVNRDLFFDDPTAFIFEEYTPWVISHEVGHTLGLNHTESRLPDGTTYGYYPGHNGWAPIMGGGLIKSILQNWNQPRTVVQWTKGEYPGAIKVQDNRAVIEQTLDLVPDDYPPTPTPVELGVPTSGFINSATDTDVFSFTTDGGPLRISADPVRPGKELDLSVTVQDARGAVVASRNTPGVEGETLLVNLSAGTYEITLDGVGTGNPLTGYSDYSSVGQYELVVADRVETKTSDFIDFDGDGVGDIFTSVPVGNAYQWQYSAGGKTPGKNLAVRSEPLGQLRFGDFDGDGKTDVFTVSPFGDQYLWKYSSGGVSTWKNLAIRDEPLSQLRFGDFDRDGITDVFTTQKQGRSNRWKYSSGGTSEWTELASAGQPLNQLRFGDFDGDGTTDVFTVSKQGSKHRWLYSSGGTKTWKTLSIKDEPLSQLRFGDFNGDGTTDVFTVAKQGNTNRWRYSSGGAANWTELLSAGQRLGELRFSDFNGDGTTDVMVASRTGNKTAPYRWLYSSGGAKRWSTLSTANQPVRLIRLGDFSGN